MNILVVDDSDLQVGLMEEILEGLGHQTVGVTTEEEAMKVLGGDKKFDGGVFDWSIEVDHGPKQYWERVIRTAAEKGITRMVINSATDDSTKRLKPLIQELTEKGIKFTVLEKNAPIRETIGRLNKEAGF